MRTDGIGLSKLPPLLPDWADLLLDVAGDRQTAPFQGSPLRLTALFRGSIVGQGAGVAVAAIMQDRSTEFADLIDAALVGMVVDLRWRSDGRSINSLGEVEFEEQLRLAEETGCFTGTGLGDFRDLFSGAVMPVGDRHASPRSVVASGPGRQVVQQVWAFLDKRTNTVGMAVRSSGCEIVREVDDPDRPGSMLLTLKKVGRAGTAEGHASGDAEAVLTV